MSEFNINDVQSASMFKQLDKNFQRQKDLKDKLLGDSGQRFAMRMLEQNLNQRQAEADALPDGVSIANLNTKIETRKEAFHRHRNTILDNIERLNEELLVAENELKQDLSLHEATLKPIMGRHNQIVQQAMIPTRKTIKLLERGKLDLFEQTNLMSPLMQRNLEARKIFIELMSRVQRLQTFEKMEGDRSVPEEIMEVEYNLILKSISSLKELMPFAYKRAILGYLSFTVGQGFKRYCERDAMLSRSKRDSEINISAHRQAILMFRNYFKNPNIQSLKLLPEEN